MFAFQTRPRPGVRRLYRDGRGQPLQAADGDRGRPDGRGNPVRVRRRRLGAPGKDNAGRLRRRIFK